MTEKLKRSTIGELFSYIYHCGDPNVVDHHSYHAGDPDITDHIATTLVTLTKHHCGKASHTLTGVFKAISITNLFLVHPSLTTLDPFILHQTSP